MAPSSIHEATGFEIRTRDIRTPPQEGYTREIEGSKE